eukprot:1158329-Pelagomonas_calceolata.AAC.24
MGIWRFFCHDPGRPDSPSPDLHCHAPSKLPPGSPLELKCMSGVNNSSYNVESMSCNSKRGSVLHLILASPWLAKLLLNKAPAVKGVYNGGLQPETLADGS